MSTEESELDLRLKGYEPADEAEGDLFDSQITLNEDMLVPLATHHDGHHTYLAAYDGSMTWSIPGSPQFLALHIVRDPAARTFRYTSERLPLFPLAQQWLIARNCPAKGARLLDDAMAPQGDEESQELEARLAASAGRYELLDHYTDDTIDHETYAVLRDVRPVTADVPFRLVLEQVDPEANLVTLRMGAFASLGDVQEWLEQRPGALPALSQARTARASAAKALPQKPPGRTR